jgi:hypothetical protein
MTSDHELIAIYKSLRRKGNSPEYSQNDALELLAVCAELGARGYVLADDESTWIKPVDGE